MSRYTGPKFKLSRREGVNVTGTTSPTLQEVLAMPPGTRGQGRPRPRKQSEYGVRLRAKQRVKAQYGVHERGLRRLFGEAERMSGPTGLNLLRLLERRLDNVVYRLGFARTVPSFLTTPNDVVELGAKGREIPVAKEEMTARGADAPWLSRDGAVGRVIGIPQREDIDADIREVQIVEFYAR